MEDGNISIVWYLKIYDQENTDYNNIYDFPIISTINQRIIIRSIYSVRGSNRNFIPDRVITPFSIALSHEINGVATP
jgi:hypothetical protein